MTSHQAYLEYVKDFESDIAYIEWLEMERKSHTYQLEQKKIFIQELIEEAVRLSTKEKRYKDILKDLVETSWGIPGGYIDIDTEYETRYSCNYCLTSWTEEEKHEKYCPIKRAKELLA